MQIKCHKNNSNELTLNMIPLRQAGIEIAYLMTTVASVQNGKNIVYWGYQLKSFFFFVRIVSKSPLLG